MPTYRTIHDRLRTYTVISNTAIRDKEISFRARGVHHYLLSKPDNWETSLSELVRNTTEGRYAIRKALRELEKRGYMYVSQPRTGKGKYLRVKYDVVENLPVCNIQQAEYCTERSTEEDKK